jgi:tetratricopeptide (TPR) repeat protein
MAAVDLEYMSFSGEPGESPVFHPQTWIDLLTAATAKRDMFSAKTLMVILDGVEHLAMARLEPGSGIIITSFHASVFERLLNSYNNAALLKSIGTLYLGEFHMPGMALKHLELAKQMAPGDRDLDQLQKAATLALAHEANDHPSHTPLDEGLAVKPEVSKVIFKTTTRLHRVETRLQLNASTGALERRQEAKRQTGKLSPAPATATAQVQDFTIAFEQIRELIAGTKFADAFAALADLVKAGAPVDDAQTCYAQLGLAAFEHNRLADALAAYLKMRDLAPEGVEGWYNCGLVYQKMAMADEALDCYEEAARLDPTNARTWCNLSSIWFDRGDYPESEAMARKALEIRADYPRALDNLAATLSAMDRLDEAAEVCQRAIRLQPNLHSAWFKLGVIKFQQEQFVPAMEAFNLTGDNPDYFPYVLYYLCMIDARRGRLDEAIQKLGDARAADPLNELEPLALKEIGAVCTKLGHHQAAADAYGQITQIQPDDVAAWLAMGTAFHRINQFTEAEAAYTRVTEIDPQNPIPWHNLGILAADQNQHSRARDCFQREVDLAPDDAKAWYDLAVAWEKVGNQEESERAFHQAEALVRTNSRKTSDLSAAMSIVRRLNLGDRVLKTGEMK